MAKKRATRRRSNNRKTSDPKDRDRRVLRSGMDIWIVYYNQENLQWRVYKSIVRQSGLHGIRWPVATISVQGRKVKLTLKDRDYQGVLWNLETIRHFAQQKNAIALAITLNKKSAKRSRRRIKHHQAVVEATKAAVTDLQAIRG